MWGPQTVSFSILPPEFIPRGNFSRIFISHFYVKENPFMWRNFFSELMNILYFSLILDFWFQPLCEKKDEANLLDSLWSILPSFQTVIISWSEFTLQWTSSSNISLSVLRSSRKCIRYIIDIFLTNLRSDTFLHVKISGTSILEK